MPDDIIPISHYVDRRANRLIAYGAATGAADDLLNTAQLADWLQVSTVWLVIGRGRGYGPPFIRIGSRVRYRRSDVLTWLDERAHRCTSVCAARPRSSNAGNGAPAANMRGEPSAHVRPVTPGAGGTPRFVRRSPIPE
jgi:predicted DNA-binding transcriptional regulator AlpA